MADNSLKRIRDIEIDESVLSIDKYGHIGAAKVIENLHSDKNTISNFTLIFD